MATPSWATRQKFTFWIIHMPAWACDDVVGNVVDGDQIDDTEDVDEVDDDDNIDGIEDVDDVGYESQNLCVQSPCRAVNCLH